MVPFVGVKELMCGRTWKLAVEVPLPAAFITVIGPLVAPLGTVAVSCVSETTAKIAAGVALNVTRVVPVNALPVMTTFVPTTPLVGLNELTIGAPGFVAPVPESKELCVPGLALSKMVSVPFCVPLT
jgi:hypothetical protein